MLQVFRNLLTGLSNILLYSYAWVTKKHPYPISILPKTKFVKEINVERLVDDGAEYLLVRRSDKGDEDTWNLETETLREDAITIEAIPNLSLNILGSRFKTPFIKFRPKGLASKPWEGRSIHFFNFRKLFLIELNGAPIYFRLKDLHGKTFPYQRIKDHGVKALIAKLKLQPLSNGKFGFKGQTRISHTPNNLNYWHSELSVCDQEQKIIKDTSNLWKKDAAGMAFAHIVTGSARRVIPSREPRIPKMHYKKD